MAFTECKVDCYVLKGQRALLPPLQYLSKFRKTKHCSFSFNGGLRTLPPVAIWRLRALHRRRRLLGGQLVALPKILSRADGSRSVNSEDNSYYGRRIPFASFKSFSVADDESANVIQQNQKSSV